MQCAERVAGNPRFSPNLQPMKMLMPKKWGVAK